jgi:hypothetical protein
MNIKIGYKKKNGETAGTILRIDGEGFLWVLEPGKNGIYKNKKTGKFYYIGDFAYDAESEVSKEKQHPIKTLKSLYGVDLIKTLKSWQVLVNKEPVLITTNEEKARRVYDKYSAIMKQQEIRKRGRTHQRGKRTLW